MTEFIEEGIVLSIQGNIAQVEITPRGTYPDNHAGCPVKALATAVNLSPTQIIILMPGLAKR